MSEFPAGSPRPGTPGPGRREALTVAQLLSRVAAHRPPAPEPPAADGTGADATAHVVSVGSLLRREGRAPHAQDRPLHPRAARQAEQAAAAWSARSSSGRRRATAVAGALVATGSVLGAALYNGASSHSSDAQIAADGLFPGLGLPTSAPVQGLPPQYLPANVSLIGPLGAPTTMSPGGAQWAALAFPESQTASRSAAPEMAATGPSASRTAVPEQRPAIDTTPQQGTGPATGGTGSGGTGSGGGSSPLLPILSGPNRNQAPNLLAPLGGSPGTSGPQTSGTGAGGGRTGGLQTLTEPTRPVGEAVGQTIRPVTQAAAPVGTALGGVLRPVGSAVRPVTNAVQPITEPVTNAVEPVTTPVLGALSPVTGPVLEGTKPVTGPVLDSLSPVTDVLNTSTGNQNRRAAGEGRSSGGRHQLGEGTDPQNTVGALTEKLGGTVGSLTGGRSSAAQQSSGTDEQDSTSSSPASSGSDKGLISTVGGTLGGLTGR